MQWTIDRKKIQHVSLKVLDLLELLHKNGVVNRGRSLKAPQRNINKEGIVVYEVSSLLNDEKRIYYEEQTKNILRSFKKKLP